MGLVEGSESGEITETMTGGNDLARDSGITKTK